MSDYTKHRNVYTPVQPREISVKNKRGKVNGKELLILAFPIGIIICMFGSFMWFTRLTSTADNVSITSPLIDTSTPFQPITNTPKPTVTPWDTHTPYPTFTPTLTHTPEPNVVYVDREIIVTVITEHVITATMLPETRTPQPSVTPTLPLVIQEMNQKIEHRMRWREISVKLAEFFLSPAALVIFLIVFVGIFGVRISVKWNTGKPNVEDTTETAAEIHERVEVQINDWREILNKRNVIRLRRQGANLSQIEQRIWPNATSRGGAHFQFVKDVLSEYDPLGEEGPTYPPPDWVTP